MKDLSEIRAHVAETIYSHRARTAIRYWLLGKSAIKDSDIIVFKDHSWKNGEQITEAKTFEDFVAWYNNIWVAAGDCFIRSIYTPICGVGTQNVTISLYDIKIGDYVKVIDLDNPRSEYIDAVINVGDKLVVCLSDGTWVTSSSVVPYKVQGEERRALIDKLNEVRK